jgi:hypothetical protein
MQSYVEGSERLLPSCAPENSPVVGPHLPRLWLRSMKVNLRQQLGLMPLPVT